MKEKTSITLSGEVLAGIDRLAGSKHSRSAFIERVLRRYLRERARAAVQARDLERINAASERLNSEAADVMEYQALDSQPAENQAQEE
jgi:metal-responsive CopG/Arc/MetJ family transcriptional regulator